MWSDPTTKASPEKVHGFVGLTLLLLAISNGLSLIAFWVDWFAYAESAGRQLEAYEAFPEGWRLATQLMAIAGSALMFDAAAAVVICLIIARVGWLLRIGFALAWLISVALAISPLGFRFIE